MSEKLFFTKRPDYDVKADVFVQEQKVEVVHEFKYLGLKHVKKVVNIAKIKFSKFQIYYK